MRRRAVAEAILALLTAAGAVISWIAASSQVVVAPVLDGEPSTVAQVYSAPLLTLSLVLATVTGVAAVFAVTHVRRARRTTLPATLPAE